MQIILASASPRRIEIMENFEIPCTVMPSNIENSLILSSTVNINTMVSAYMKANSIFEQCKDDSDIDENDIVVIGADTVVSIGEYQLGKPKDKNDSFKMLKLLSGKMHNVTTGFAIISSNTKYVDFVSTSVTFKNLTDEMIMDYIYTGEGDDKAGSYAIQGKGSILVKEITGDFLNVVGLPISRIFDVLKEKLNIDLLNCGE